MASGSLNDVVNDKRHLAAWGLLIAIVVGVIVLGLLDTRAKQNKA